MTTYKELHKEVSEKTFKLSVVEHLVQYLDQTFCSDMPGKMVLQTEDGLPVPEWAVEAVTGDLVKIAESLTTDLNNLTSSEVVGGSAEVTKKIKKPSTGK